MIDKLISVLVEVVGWIAIVLANSLLGGFVMFVITFGFQTKDAFIIGLGFIPVGFLVGILWANQVWRNGGTVQFYSRLIAHPELDERFEEEQKARREKGSGQNSETESI